MNLYTSLLLSTVIITSAGSVFAAEDNQGKQPEATGNILTRNAGKVRDAMANGYNGARAAVEDQFSTLLVDFVQRDYKSVAKNPITIAAATTTAVGVGAAATYMYLKNRKANEISAEVKQTELVHTSENRHEESAPLEGYAEVTITRFGDLAAGQVRLSHTVHAVSVECKDTPEAIEQAILDIATTISKIS